MSLRDPTTKQTGHFRPTQRGRRAFWHPSAARLLGVPSLSDTPSSPLLDGCQKSRRRNPAITRTGSCEVISDPAVNGNNVVIVLFVSWTEKYDQACVLHGGEHPFIKHETCVQYPGAKVVANARLEELRKSGQLRPKAALSAGLLALIREKAENADLPTFAYEILREQGFVP